LRFNSGEFREVLQKMIFLFFSWCVLVGQATAQCSATTLSECEVTRCCGDSGSGPICRWECGTSDGVRTVCHERKRLVADIREALNGKLNGSFEHALFHTDAPLPESLAHMSVAIAEHRPASASQTPWAHANVAPVVQHCAK
jgi:hypothetical protein